MSRARSEFKGDPKIAKGQEIKMEQKGVERHYNEKGEDYIYYQVTGAYKDFYEIFGLSRQTIAPEDEKAFTHYIEREYRRLSAYYHPDKKPTVEKEKWEEQFKYLGIARDTLLDRDKRRIYDQRISGVVKNSSEIRTSQQSGRPSTPWAFPFPDESFFSRQSAPFEDYSSDSSSPPIKIINKVLGTDRRDGIFTKEEKDTYTVTLNAALSSRLVRALKRVGDLKEGVDYGFVSANTLWFKTGDKFKVEVVGQPAYISEISARCQLQMTGQDEIYSSDFTIQNIFNDNASLTEPFPENKKTEIYFKERSASGDFDNRVGARSKDQAKEAFDLALIALRTANPPLVEGIDYTIKQKDGCFGFEIGRYLKLEPIEYRGKTQLMVNLTRSKVRELIIKFTADQLLEQRMKLEEEWKSCTHIRPDLLVEMNDLNDALKALKKPIPGQVTAQEAKALTLDALFSMGKVTTTMGTIYEDGEYKSKPRLSLAFNDKAIVAEVIRKLKEAGYRTSASNYQFHDVNLTNSLRIDDEELQKRMKSQLVLKLLQVGKVQEIKDNKSGKKMQCLVFEDQFIFDEVLAKLRANYNESPKELPLVISKGDFRTTTIPNSIEVNPSLFPSLNLQPLPSSPPTVASMLFGNVNIIGMGSAEQDDKEKKKGQSPSSS